MTIRDGKAADAIEFYKRAFGAEEMTRAPAEGSTKLMHAHLRINGDSIMLADDFPEWKGGVEAGAPTGITLHLQVDDADRWWNRAVEAGATVTMPLADQFWGDRYGSLKDPYGHSWSIGSPVKR
jgi:PhnB protein